MNDKDLLVARDLAARNLNVVRSTRDVEDDGDVRKFAFMVPVSNAMLEDGAVIRDLMDRTGDDFALSGVSVDGLSRCLTNGHAKSRLRSRGQRGVRVCVTCGMTESPWVFNSRTRRVHLIGVR